MLNLMRGIYESAPPIAIVEGAAAPANFSARGCPTRPRARARADVPQPLDRRRMAGAPRERPPQEVLVERECAAVRVAVPQVHVHALEVVRPERHPLDDRRLEGRDVPHGPCLDAVCVALSRVVVPREARGALLALD